MSTFTVNVMSKELIPPTVDAGPPVDITTTGVATASLDGTISDPGSSPVDTILWELISGPTGTPTIDSDSTIDTGISNIPESPNGEYIFKVTVTNQDGISASDTTTINVSIVTDATAIDNTIEIDYDSSETPANQMHIFAYNAITNGYNNTQGTPINRIKITSLPARGELYLDGVAISVNDEITVAEIQGNDFEFFPADFSGTGESGDYVTTFGLIIIDNSNVESNVSNITIDATDVVVVVEGDPSHFVITTGTCFDSAPLGDDPAWVDVWKPTGTNSPVAGDQWYLDEGLTVPFVSDGNPYRIAIRPNVNNPTVIIVYDNEYGIVGGTNIIGRVRTCTVPEDDSYFVAIPGTCGNLVPDGQNNSWIDLWKDDNNPPEVGDTFYIDSSLSSEFISQPGSTYLMGVRPYPNDSSQVLLYDFEVTFIDNQGTITDITPCN